MEGLDLSLFLIMGEILALSQSDGKEPSSENLQKMTCKIGALL